MNKNYSISICRIISMFMIVLCHIIEFYDFIPGSSFLGNFFNCAVYTFLGISGYLYGKKEINNFSKWFKSRLVTVCLPACIFSLLILIIRCIIGQPNQISSFLVYPFCLKGFIFIFPALSTVFPEVPVLGPLWFITVIMICYCLIPLLEKIRNYNSKLLMPLLIFAGG